MIAAGYTTDMQPYFDQLSTAFEAANPGINVDVQVVSWNDIDQKVSTLVQTQQFPDIVNLNSFAGYAADDLLYTSDQIVTPEVHRRHHPGVHGQDPVQRHVVRGT